MRAATKTLLMLIGLAAASTACRQAPPEDNFAIDNGAAGQTDIEALPPDESSAIPSNELANGGDEASNVNQLANSD